MSFDWKKSQQEVYIQQHGSEAYWIALLDDDGKLPGARVGKGERKLMGMVHRHYNSVFDSFKLMAVERRRERLAEYQGMIRSATEKARSEASSYLLRTYPAVLGREESKALSALASLATLKPPKGSRKRVRAQEKTSSKTPRVAAPGRQSGVTKTKVGNIAVAARRVQQALVISWQLTEGGEGCTSWVVVLKRANKVLHSHSVMRGTAEIVLPLDGEVPDRVIVFARTGRDITVGRGEVRLS